jgi:hypothetical protein
LKYKQYAELMFVIGVGSTAPGVAAQPNANSPAAAGATNPNAANAGGQGVGSTVPATGTTTPGVAAQPNANSPAAAGTPNQAGELNLIVQVNKED